MDELFPLLMFLIFILGPIFEGISRNRKKGQQPPPPTQRRVPPVQSSRTEEISTRSRAEDDASSMVPDELWEILTGQQRPPVQRPTPTQPSPLDSRAEKRPSWDVVYDPELDEDEEAELEVVTAEDVNVETRRARVEAQSLETLERHPVPVVVSLEENIPTTAVRHAAFHQKMSQQQAAAVVQLPERRRPQLLDFKNRSEIQRAFLLSEVFGKPKGLE
jgi:hypothetical protein